MGGGGGEEGRGCGTGSTTAMNHASVPSAGLFRCFIEGCVSTVVFSADVLLGLFFIFVHVPLPQLGTGMLRVIQGDRQAVSDIIPVDLACSMMITTAWYTATRR